MELEKKAKQIILSGKLSLHEMINFKPLFAGLESKYFFYYVIYFIFDVAGIISVQ